jgi:hypothetical protein
MTHHTAVIGRRTPSGTTRPLVGRSVSFDWVMLVLGGWLLGGSMWMAGPTITSRPPWSASSPPGKHGHDLLYLCGELRRLASTLWVNSSWSLQRTHH